MIQSIIFGIIFIGVGIFVFIKAFKRMKEYTMIKDIPTSKIRSVAMGIAEVIGKAYSNSLLVSPFSKKECVYYKYDIKELRTRGSGKNRRTSWESIARGEQKNPFKVKDDTGELLIKCSDAEFMVDCKAKYYEKAGLFGGLGRTFSMLKDWGSGRGKLLDIDVSKFESIDPKKPRIGFQRTGDRQYYEYYITPEETIYAMGTVVNEGKDGVFMRKGINNPMFLVSDKSEEVLLKSLRWKMIGLFLLGLLLIPMGSFALLIGIGVF